MPLNAPETGGRFRVWVDVGKGKGDKLVWDRKVRLEHSRICLKCHSTFHHPSKGKEVAELMISSINTDGRRFPRTEGLEAEDKECSAA